MLPPCPTVSRAFDLFHAKKFDLAERILRRHLTKEPADATGHHILAAVLLSKGQLAQAAFFAARANELFPHDFAILSVLGTALASSGDSEPAVGAYREAASLAPEKPTLWSGLGVALMAVGKLDEAIPAFEKAIAIDPKELSGPMNLAVCLMRLGDANSTRRVVQAAMEHFPRNGPLLLQAAAVSNYADLVSAAESRALHDSLARSVEVQAKNVRSMKPTPLGGRPLRVGLLSGDFYNHSCSFFLEPLLAYFADEEHRRAAQLDLTCFSSTHANDDITRRLRAFGHPWRDVLKLSDEACADAIRSDRIDALIDCAGYTHDTRVQVLAHRTAPIQMTYLGYPNTTALKECDYRIVDSFTDPLGSESLCSERLIRLDPHFLCYTPLRHDRAADINPEPPMVRTGRVTFASFNALMKVVDSTIAAWARLLNEVPGSRLLLKGKHDSSVARINAAFQSHGVDPQRVELLRPVHSTAAHMTLYNDVDVALDPFPYNGTTTTYESLVMGVPVVALAGDRHASRVGVSILSTVGLSELIAPDVNEYVRIAATLAGDTARLATLRRDLRGRLIASPACDQDAFATRFARALHAAWEERVAAAR